MFMRPIQLPSDFAALSDILLASFHYPENEAWSVQSDEKEQLVDMIKNLARLWPLSAASSCYHPLCGTC